MDRLGFGAAVSGFTPPALFDCLSAKVGVFLIDGAGRTAFSGFFPVVAMLIGTLPCGSSRSGVLFVEPAPNTEHLLGSSLNAGNSVNV